MDPLHATQTDQEDQQANTRYAPRNMELFWSLYSISNQCLKSSLGYNGGCHNPLKGDSHDWGGWDRPHTDPDSSLDNPRFVHTKIKPKTENNSHLSRIIRGCRPDYPGGRIIRAGLLTKSAPTSESVQLGRIWGQTSSGRIIRW